MTRAKTGTETSKMGWVLVTSAHCFEKSERFKCIAVFHEGVYFLDRAVFLRSAYFFRYKKPRCYCLLKVHLCFFLKSAVLFSCILICFWQYADTSILTSAPACVLNPSRSNKTQKTIPFSLPRACGCWWKVPLLLFQLRSWVRINPSAWTAKPTRPPLRPNWIGSTLSRNYVFFLQNVFCRYHHKCVSACVGGQAFYWLGLASAAFFFLMPHRSRRMICPANIFAKHAASGQKTRGNYWAVAQAG